MAVRALDNSTWGFPSSCFVCEPSNDRGLRIPFSHDEESGLVTASFRLGPELSGAPRYVHGGVVLAILDEAMAWAAIAVAGRFAVVQHTATTFERPVRVDEPYVVEASVQASDERSVTARAEVRDGAGRPCAKAHARLSVIREAEAESALGPMGDDDRRYLRSGTEGERP